MSQNDYTWEFNGVRFEFDIEDADTADRFEAAVDDCDRKLRNLRKDGNLSDVIRRTCDVYHEFFDMLFGAGASDKLFGGKKNIRVCEDAYFNSLIPFIREQTLMINNRRNGAMRDVNNSFKPNRQQRRHNGGNQQYKNNRNNHRRK